MYWTHIKISMWTTVHHILNVINVIKFQIVQFVLTELKHMKLVKCIDSF